jgi:TonB-dependent receptor
MSKRFALGIVMLALFAAAPLAAQDLGALVGRVTGPQGNPVVGAEVSVTDTGLIQATDEQGGYRITAVPPGEHVVLVTFLGTKPETAAVTVTAGVTTTVDVQLSLANFEEEIVVRGTPIAAGQASALNQQRAAINITNVVSADQMGRFPDPNAAEATQRVPAVTLLRDQGEGRYVLVRGTEARLNSTTVDGERIPSPEADTRDIALDVIPADLLQAIEVSKALTPDMDGDAIGGAVNLVTKRAPEGLRVSGTAAYGMNDLTEEPIENANFTVGDRFGDDNKLGIIASGSLYDTERGSDNFEVEYDDDEVENFELRDYEMQRQRYGATASLDYRATDQTTFYGRYLWNEYKDDEVRRGRVSAVSDEELVRAMRQREEASKITSFTLGGDTQIGTSTVIEFRGAYNRAQENNPSQLQSDWKQEDVEFFVDASDPDNIQAEPLNEDLEAYELDGFELSGDNAEEDDIVGSVEVAHSFYRDAGLSGTVTAGLKARFKEKNQNADVVELDFDDPGFVNLLSGWQSQTPFLDGRYDIGPFADPGKVRGLLGQAGIEEERNLEEDLADFVANEDTLAAFAMGELEIGARTSLLGGVRVERTETEFDAFELEVDEEGDPVALTPVAGGNDYLEWLPMVHLKHRFDERTNFRVAVTRSLARPNFIDLAPYQLLLEEDLEIERGNPDLDVTTSWNLDLFAERYFEPLGLIAAGVFYKQLSDNVFPFRFEEDRGGETYDVFQKRNGGDAEILGAEIAVQNNFSNGFGIYFNASWADSEAEYPDREKDRLQGQADLVGNFAVAFERARFSGRASLNYNGDYILEIGEEAAEDLYVDEHVQLDVSAAVQLGRGFSVNLQLINLTDEPYRVFEGSVDRPIQEEYYSWWGTIGIKYDL